MTEEQRAQCNALIQHLQDAGINISLHEFRTTSGYRVVGTDDTNRRFQRDGEDPVELLAKTKQLFGIKDKPEIWEAKNNPEPLDAQGMPEIADVQLSPESLDSQNTPEDQQEPPQ